MAKSTATMAKRRRRSVRRRPPPSTEGGGGGGVEHGRDWSCLPDTALLSISQKAASFIHYYAIAGTCRTWRTVAMAALPEFMSSQPPLLCRSDGSLVHGPLEGRSYRNQLLDALLKPTVTIADICHGYLVLDERDHRSLLQRREMIKLRFFNPFSGDEAPSVPGVAGAYLHWVLLTAPPRSPDCTVVASIQELSGENEFPKPQTLVYCRPGDTCWRFRRSRETESFCERPVASPDGRRLYTWNNSFQILIFEFTTSSDAGDLHLRVVARMEGVERPLPSCFFSSLLPLLAVSGAGELLCVEDTSFTYDDLVGIRTVPAAMTGTVAMFRLDVPRRRWVRVESLGGGALLLTGTKCVVSDDPARWGGKKDHVYIATPELGALMVFPFCGRGDSVPASSVTSLPLPAPLKCCPGSNWLLPGLSCP